MNNFNLICCCQHDEITKANKLLFILFTATDGINMYDVLLLATVFLGVYEMCTSIYVIKYNALPTCHTRRKIKNAH